MSHFDGNAVELLYSKLNDVSENKHTIQAIYFQEPEFNSLDKDFLKSRGYEVLDSPSALDFMTEETFLYTPFCPMNWLYACMHRALPSMALGRDIATQKRWFRSPEARR